MCHPFADLPFASLSSVLTKLGSGQEHPEVEWAAVLDASDLVVKGGNSLQSFLPREGDIDLVLMEGVLGGELMSSYLIRNTDWAVGFLLQWADYGGKVLDQVPNMSSIKACSIRTANADVCITPRVWRTSTAWTAQHSICSSWTLSCQITSRYISCHSAISKLEPDGL